MCLTLCSHCWTLFRSVVFLGSGILKKLLPFVVLPVVFVHLYAWQVGILINVNVNCEIMKCNKHQQQITYKRVICITETETKFSIYRALHVTKSEANKILEFFAFDIANYSFYLLCIMALFLMKKVFFIF